MANYKFYAYKVSFSFTPNYWWAMHFICAK